MYRANLPNIKNPMDFQFFSQVVRSEDEASSQANWHQLRSKLAGLPVTPKVNLQDVKEKKDVELDLEQYLPPHHLHLMVAKLNEAQLSSLVARLMSTICNVEIR